MKKILAFLVLGLTLFGCIGIGQPKDRITDCTVYGISAGKCGGGSYTAPQAEINITNKIENRCAYKVNGYAFTEGTEMYPIETFMRPSSFDDCITLFGYGGCMELEEFSKSQNLKYSCIQFHYYENHNVACVNQTETYYRDRSILPPSIMRTNVNILPECMRERYETANTNLNGRVVQCIIDKFTQTTVSCDIYSATQPTSNQAVINELLLTLTPEDCKNDKHTVCENITMSDGEYSKCLTLCNGMVNYTKIS